MNVTINVCVHTRVIDKTFICTLVAIIFDKKFYPLFVDKLCFDSYGELFASQKDKAKDIRSFVLGA